MKNDLSKERQQAIHIIEEVIEPLLCKLERSGADLEDGLNGELYYETEDLIVEVIKRIK
jgi:hypothetical protein